MASGIVFGKNGDKWIGKREEMDGHILVVGGAGSGKTSCVAIPTLRTWGEQVFAIDIKGELYNEVRHKRPNIKIFEPLNKLSFGYDPFYILKNSKNLAQEVEAISHALVPLPRDIREPFWVESARNMLSGAVLHFHNLGYSFIKTITEIQSTPVNKLIEDIFDTTESDEARLYINSFLGLDGKTLSGIYAELSRNIMIFATDGNIKECLSRERTIKPDDLERNNDVFICIPEHLLRQWKNLLNLIISQFLRHFERRPERQASPILFLLDEFPRLGKIEGITDALATLRSKKVTICPIIQSLAQLDMIYGREVRQVIADNCQFKAVLGATDRDSQKYFSDIVGTHEQFKITTNRHYSGRNLFPSYGTNYTTEKRERMKPEDFANLGGKLALFTPDGFMMVEKAPYYQDSY